MNIERYKPKGKDMNDWYKNGELPPIGSVVEVLGGAYGSDEMVWRKSEIYAHIEGRVLAESTSHSGVYKLYLANECRPLRTETDKLVEEACKLIDEPIEKYTLDIDCSAAIKATIPQSQADVGR